MAHDDYGHELGMWRDQVGGFILGFGEIEFITYQLWAEHCPGRSPPHRFERRTELLIEMLERDLVQYGLLVAALKQGQELAVRRNTIAHNPMQVQVYKHTKTGQVFFEQAIESAKGLDYIDDATLKELVAEVEDLVSRLYIMVGYVPKQAKAR